MIARVIAVLLLLVLASGALAATQASVRPVPVTAETRAPVRAPVIAVGGFDYVLQQPPSSITMPSSGLAPTTSTRSALLGAIATGAGRFSGGFSDQEERRRQSSHFWRFLLAVVLALAALISGVGITQWKAEERRALVISLAIYFASAGFILYRMTHHFEVRLVEYYGGSFFGVMHELAESLSPVLLVFVGLGMIATSFDRETARRPLNALIGAATIVGALGVLAAAMMRGEIAVIVDNATDAPYRIAVDGVALGVLPPRTNARITLCLGSRFHPRTAGGVFVLRNPQGSPRTLRIDLAAADSSLLLLNVGNKNEYAVSRVRYAQ